MAVGIRDATAGDSHAGGDLLYLPSTGLYDLWFGGPRRALPIMRRLFAVPGHAGSHSITRLAIDHDGRQLGALASFPISENDRLQHAFSDLARRAVRPWRRRPFAAITAADEELRLDLPPGSLYVDALAVDPSARRLGVATALLADARDRARRLGLTRITLDTAVPNTEARALYERLGFEVCATAEPGPAATAIGAPAIVGYALVV